MSAYKWLKFAAGVPIAAALLAVVYEFTNPATGVLETYSTTPESATGVQWYGDLMTWLPLIVLLLLAFMVIVAIITRRRSVRP